jgi:mannosyltransferase
MDWLYRDSGRSSNKIAKEMSAQLKLSQAGVILILIVALAAALRFYGLEIQSLWNDELSSWNRSYGQSFISALRNAKSDAHPPLYHIIVWIVSNYIGDDPRYLRLPSAIFGILAVYRIYFLASDVYNHRAGLFAAATLAVSYTALFFSQEGRSNSLVALLTILATHEAFRIAETLCRGEHLARWTILRLCLWSSLLIYTHYFGILSVVAQAFALLTLCLIYCPSRLQSLMLCYLAIALSYLPWLPAMIFQLRRGALWLTEPGLNDLVQFGEFLIKGIETQVVLAGLVMIAAAALAVGNVRPASDQIGRRIAPSGVLVSVIVLPPILAVILSYLIVPIFNSRNLIGVLPVMCVMVGTALSWGVDVWDTRFKGGQLIETALLILPTLSSLFIVMFFYRYYAMPNKEQFREAVLQVVNESLSQLHPRAAFCASSMRYLTYYSSRANWRGQFDPMLCSVSDLTRIDLHSENTPQEFWFVWAHTRPDPLLLAELKKTFSVALRGRYLKAEVYSLSPRPTE